MKKVMESLKTILLILAIVAFLTTMNSFGQGDNQRAVMTGFFAIWCQLAYLITNKNMEGQK